MRFGVPVANIWQVANVLMRSFVDCVYFSSRGPCERLEKVQAHIDCQDDLCDLE